MTGRERHPSGKFCDAIISQHNECAAAAGLISSCAFVFNICTHSAFSNSRLILKRVFMGSRQSLRCVFFQSNACRNLPSLNIFSLLCVKHAWSSQSWCSNKAFHKVFALHDVVWFVMHEVCELLYVIITHCGHFTLIVFFMCTADWIWSQMPNIDSLYNWKQFQPSRVKFCNIEVPIKSVYSLFYTTTAQRHDQKNLIKVLKPS